MYSLTELRPSVGGCTVPQVCNDDVDLVFTETNVLGHGKIHELEFLASV